MLTLDHFNEVWAVDFEFHQPRGERPDVICMTAREIKSGRSINLWQDQLRRLSKSPMNVGTDSLMIAYYASAEINCFLSLEWNPPTNLLDLYAEFRCQVNGLPYPFDDKPGWGLVQALKWFDIQSLDCAHKLEMQGLAIRGGPFTAEEKDALMDYCERDVLVLPQLLASIECGLNNQGFDLNAALIRGEYVKVVAHMESRGIPIDVDSWKQLQAYWPAVSQCLIDQIDKDFGVYENESLKQGLFEKYLEQNQIPWERLPSGRIRLERDYFSDMSDTWPSLKPLHELRTCLSQMRTNKLAIGSDGRNRTLLGPFGASSGRNTHRAGEYIFGQPAWLRGLIKPQEGFGLAYIDWCHQEYGIAAALSGDEAMMVAYQCGDPYVALGIACGDIPENASKETHPDKRELYKQCALGIQYGMGSRSLGFRLGKPEVYARWILDQHRRKYSKLWNWSDSVLGYASLHGRLWTTYGWERKIPGHFSPASIRNFPVQGNAADMLRLACIECERRGVNIVATLHDAILIEFDLHDEHEAILSAQDAMLEASRLVLAGFELSSEVNKILYPNRYMNERGVEMWNRVWKIVSELKARKIRRQETLLSTTRNVM